MKKSDQTQQRALVKDLGMKFEEASELFSPETLDSMQMTTVLGGTGEAAGNNCHGAFCGNCVPKCHDDNNKYACEAKGYCPEKPTTQPPTTTSPL